MSTNHTPEQLELAAGCGTGSDGFPCSPAYLCPQCIQELLAIELGDTELGDA